jgi:hypothetical protein
VDRHPDRLAGVADPEFGVAVEQLADRRRLHQAVGPGHEDAASSPATAP